LNSDLLTNCFYSQLRTPALTGGLKADDRSEVDIGAAFASNQIVKDLRLQIDDSEKSLPEAASKPYFQMHNVMLCIQYFAHRPRP